MTYNSLIDKLSKRVPIWESLIKSQYYNGNLESVLSETENLLDKSKLSTQDLAKLIFHAPRIIRACIDYKVDNSAKEEIINKTNKNVYMSYIQDSINLSLDIYSGKKIKNQILDFREKIRNQGNTDLLYKKLFQGVDSVTLDATHPDDSIKSLELLTNQFKGSNLLFVSLAHGSIIPGIDIFLRYKNKTKNTNSIFYTVRFSNKKMDDQIPQLIPQEIKYLRNMSKNMNIVVFDEDVNTGKTLMIANNYFKENIFKKEFYLLTNKGRITSNANFSTSSEFADYMPLLNI